MNLSRLGGNTTRTTELFRGLKRKGIEVHSTLPNGCLDELLKLLKPYTEFSLPQPKNPTLRYITTELWNQYLLPDELFDGDWDITHIDAAHMYPFSSLKKAVKKKPSVFDLHSIPALDLEPFFPTGIRTPIMSSLLHIQRNAIRAAKCIAVSYTMKEYLKRAFTDKGDDIYVVWPGVNIELSKKSISKFSSKYERMTSGFFPVLVFVGVLESSEGIENILLALPTLKKRFPQLKFLIAGRGPNEKRLRFMVSKLKIESLVEFLGWVPYEETFALQHVADILLAPLLQPDRGSLLSNIIAPVKIPAYLSAGKPIITSNVGDVGRMIRHESEALILNHTNPRTLIDAITEIASNSLLSERMGENCLRRLNAFSWDVAASKLSEVYELAEKSFN